MSGTTGAPSEFFYVWHLPVRVTHWANVAAFFTLALTGLYIGAPAAVAVHVPQMTYVRMVHVAAGYVLLCSVAIRFYWAFVGARGASWRAFFPYLRTAGRRKMIEELQFYAFLRRDPPRSSSVINVSHSIVFLGFVVEIVTGFALLSVAGSHGILAPLFAPLFALVAPQNVRLVHVVVMWFLLAFTVEHIYVAVLLDWKERSLLLASMITGYMGHERRH